jgi:L-ascorbate metabolism protein UlaG (beta-lactamase superfamily)
METEKENKRRHGMKIKWNGHASFTITASDGIVLVTDPYDPKAFGGVFEYDMVTDRADGVLVSHDNHVKGLSGSPEVLRGSGRIGDIPVRAIETAHDESGGKERGSNTVFSFEMDGIRICFVGDLGHQLSGEQVDAIGPVDVLLTPVGGTFTVDAQGAAELVKALSPKVVIPMHFKTEKSHLPIAGAEDFLNVMGGSTQTGKSEIEVTAGDLPTAGTEVWVLEHAC